MYNTVEELYQISKEAGQPMWQEILAEEIRITEKTEAEVWKQLELRYEIMRHGIEAAFEHPEGKMKTLISGMAERQTAYEKAGNTLCGGFLNKVMARALALSETNASMGKICAAPTAGSCGILPAVLVSLEEERKISRRKVLEALLTASGIGAVVMKNATVSGAEGGCQAECGVAAAMAAAAAVYLADGSLRQQVDAVSFALMNVMGLVCDPVAGLVQIPCAHRNASQAVNALLSADMAMAGTESPIPADEVIAAMYQVGQRMAVELKETALGGIAATEAGKRLATELLK